MRGARTWKTEQSEESLSLWGLIQFLYESNKEIGDSRFQGTLSLKTPHRSAKDPGSKAEPDSSPMTEVAHIHDRTHMHMNAHTQVQAHMHEHSHSCLYSHTHTHIYICTCTHTHAHCLFVYMHLCVRNN